MKLGVLVYLENKEERLLMIHRDKEDEHKGLWLAPGGKIEPNEAPCEAAIREMKEETGLKIYNSELRAVLSFPDNGDSPFGDEWHVFVFYSKNNGERNYGVLLRLKIPQKCSSNPFYLPQNMHLNIKIIPTHSIYHLKI